MADVYEILRPYLKDVETFDALIRAMFDKEPDDINRLYEALTQKSSDDVAGIDIIFYVTGALKENDLAAFIALMKGA
jgi:hypothetical protein